MTLYKRLGKLSCSPSGTISMPFDLAPALLAANEKLDTIIVTTVSIEHSPIVNVLTPCTSQR